MMKVINDDVTIFQLNNSTTKLGAPHELVIFLLKWQLNFDCYSSWLATELAA
jgi:hypothetical protein